MMAHSISFAYTTTANGGFYENTSQRISNTNMPAILIKYFELSMPRIPSVKNLFSLIFVNLPSSLNSIYGASIKN